MRDLDVVVLGSARSGTTHLAERLRSRYQLEIGPETHLLSSVFRRRVSVDLLQHGSAADLASAIAACPEFSGVEFSVDRFRDCFEAASSWNRLHRALVATVEASVDAPDGVALGEKTPQHVRYWRVLAELAPHARFLVVVRDPRAVAASRQQTGWAASDPVTVALHWRKDRADLRAAQQALTSRVLTVRFEDLVTDPERTNKLIDGFIGLAQRSTVLGPSALAAPGERWKDSTDGEPRADRAHAGERLAPRDRKLVEMICWPDLLRDGYVADGSRPKQWPAPNWALRVARLARGELSHWRHERLLYNLIEPASA